MRVSGELYPMAAPAAAKPTCGPTKRGEVEVEVEGSGGKRVSESDASAEVQLQVLAQNFIFVSNLFVTFHFSGVCAVRTASSLRKGGPRYL